MSQYQLRSSQKSTPPQKSISSKSIIKFTPVHKTPAQPKIKSIAMPPRSNNQSIALLNNLGIDASSMNADGINLATTIISGIKRLLDTKFSEERELLNAKIDRLESQITVLISGIDDKNQSVSPLHCSRTSCPSQSLIQSVIGSFEV